MLSLSRPAARRCGANSSSSSNKRAAVRALRVCTASAATKASSSSATAAADHCRTGFRRTGWNNLKLRQRSARREVLPPLAAAPDDRQSGDHPESGTGSSGSGRNADDRPMPGSQPGSDVGSAPESGTRPESETTSGTSAAGSTFGMSGGEGRQPSAGSGSSERGSDDYTAATGGQAPSSKQSPALNQRTRAARTDDLSGTMPGGPQEVLMGQAVPSSDTHPDMDPSESRMYAEREGKGSGSMKEQGVSSSSHGEQGRDESDQQSGAGRDDAGGSSTRIHPAARTAATAIGSAAGTVLGAVGGPVGAAAGAALGGGVGRSIADALGGGKEQAEVYDQGAEPEQVAEEAMAVGDAALRATGDIAEDIRGAASKAQAAASDLVDRASERLSDSSSSGGSSSSGRSSSSSSTASEIRNRARADLDADRAGQGDVQGSIGSSVEFKSGDKSSKHGKDSHSHKGVVGHVKESVTGAAKSAVDKGSSATGGLELPTFPPATGEGRGGDNAAAAAAAEGLEDSEARAADAGWGAADQAKDWAGVGDWTNAEAVVKLSVGTPIDRRDATSMMQSDGMDLTQMVSATSAGGELGPGEGGIVAGGSAQAAGGYGGGSTGELNVDAVREKAGVIGGSNAELMSAQDQEVGKDSAAGSTGGGPTGVAAVDESLPEGMLAAGGPDAQAAMGTERGESSSEITSDSTAERVAQVYGVPPEGSTGKEEADTYRAEAGQEGTSS